MSCHCQAREESALLAGSRKVRTCAVHVLVAPLALQASVNKFPALFTSLMNRNLEFGCVMMQGSAAGMSFKFRPADQLQLLSQTNVLAFGVVGNGSWYAFSATIQQVCKRENVERVGLGTFAQALCECAP